MKYKMFVTDYDNTLLRTDHTILPKTWQAIKEFESRGGKFMIATGRMTKTMLQMVKPFGLKGEIITFQGGAVNDVNSGEELLKKHVKIEDGLELLLDLQKEGYYIQTYDKGDYFVNRYTKRTERYEMANNLPPVVVGEDIYSYVVKNKQNIDKIVFALDDDGKIDKYEYIAHIIQKYQRKYEGRLVFNSSSTMLIEATSVGCTKGEAVEWVADRHGIKREEVICIGDALNDATMVKWAGLGVAVENATFDLKEVADVITVSCDDDAVGKIIREYCLEE